MSVSVLISVYKSERPEFLQRALQSVWDDQTLKPDEIVLIEDGPLTQDLLNVLGDWKNRLGDKLQLIINKQNLGLTKSLNKGLKVCRGIYIARMDSDDISMPHRFEAQCNYLDTHPDISVVGGSLQEFNADCDNLGIRHYPISNVEARKYIRKASPLAHPTVMMRREMFDNGLMYDERFRTSQDIALWFDVLASGRKIANLNEVTIKFRRDGDVFKRRSRDKAKNELKIYLHGIKRLYGSFNPYYIFPIARFIFRMMPVGVVKAIYGSQIRSKFLH